MKNNIVYYHIHMAGDSSLIIVVVLMMGISFSVAVSAGVGFYGYQDGWFDMEEKEDASNTDTTGEDVPSESCITVYKDIDYAGGESTFCGKKDLKDDPMDKNISSMKIPANTKVTLYKNNDFTDVAKEYTAGTDGADIPNFVIDGINDAVSSLHVVPWTE